MISNDDVHTENESMQQFGTVRQSNATGRIHTFRHYVILLSTNKFNLSMTLKMFGARKSRKNKLFTIDTDIYVVLRNVASVEWCQCDVFNGGTRLSILLLHEFYSPATNFVFV